MPAAAESTYTDNYDNPAFDASGYEKINNRPFTISDGRYYNTNSYPVEHIYSEPTIPVAGAVGGGYVNELPQLYERSLVDDGYSNL